LRRRSSFPTRLVHGTTFYHKRPLPEIPPAVHQLTIQKSEGNQGTRLWVDSLNGFLCLVDISAVELYPWNATVDDIERADQIIFYPDPGQGIERDFAIETSFRLQEVLEGEELQPWRKLTGAKGLHVMASLPSPLTHDRGPSYARHIVQRFAPADRQRYVTSAAPKKRAGHIFLDYLRNERCTTTIGTYSPRTSEGFSIAAPISWASSNAA